MKTIQIFKINKAGLLVAVVAIVALTKGVGTVQGQGVSVTVPAPAVTVASPDVYVYYPHYGVYYNRDRHQFFYLKSGVWVTAPAPEGVSIDVLLASPSVRMDFHDTPEHHHREIIKKYPRDWKDDRHDHDHDGDRH